MLPVKNHSTSQSQLKGHHSGCLTRTTPGWRTSWLCRSSRAWMTQASRLSFEVIHIGRNWGERSPTIAVSKAKQLMQTQCRNGANKKTNLKSVPPAQAVLPTSAPATTLGKSQAWCSPPQSSTGLPARPWSSRSTLLSSGNSSLGPRNKESTPRDLT
jgi:hypothetical protein